jgi:hypothetical protein
VVEAVTWTGESGTAYDKQRKTGRLLQADIGLLQKRICKYLLVTPPAGASAVVTQKRRQGSYL